MQQGAQASAVKSQPQEPKRELKKKAKNIAEKDVSRLVVDQKRKDSTLPKLMELPSRSRMQLSNAANQTGAGEGSAGVVQRLGKR